MAPTRSTESADANKAFFTMYMRLQEKKARAFESHHSSKASSSAEGRRRRSGAYKRRSGNRAERVNRTPCRVTIPSSDSSPSTSSCGSSPRTPIDLHEGGFVRVKSEATDAYSPMRGGFAPERAFQVGASSLVRPECSAAHSCLSPDDPTSPTFVDLFSIREPGMDHAYLKQFGQTTPIPNLDSEMEDMFEAFINKSAYAEGQPT